MNMNMMVMMMMMMMMNFFSRNAVYELMWNMYNPTGHDNKIQCMLNN